MSIYAISFRIGDTGPDPSYEARYQSLVAAIHAQTHRYWDETTSFFLIESNKSPGTLADALVDSSSFDPRKDLMLVVNLSDTRGEAVRGNYKDQDVNALLRAR
jgi:hypothetical protein